MDFLGTNPLDAHCPFHCLYKSKWDYLGVKRGPPLWFLLTAATSRTLLDKKVLLGPIFEYMASKLGGHILVFLNPTLILLVVSAFINTRKI